MEIFENGNGYVGFGEEKGKAKQGKKEKKNGEWRDEKNERNGVGRGLLDYANPRAVTAGGK